MLQNFNQERNVLIFQCNNFYLGFLNLVREVRKQENQTLQNFNQEMNALIFNAIICIQNFSSVDHVNGTDIRFKHNGAPLSTIQEKQQKKCSIKCMRKIIKHFCATFHESSDLSLEVGYRCRLIFLTQIQITYSAAICATFTSYVTFYLQPTPQY